MCIVLPKIKMNNAKNKTKVETSSRYNQNNHSTLILSTTERTTTSRTLITQHQAHNIQTQVTRNLGGRKLSYPPTQPSLKLSSHVVPFRAPTSPVVDAKPFTPNYQSPLQRRTPLYQSLRTPTTPTYSSPPRPTVSSLSLAEKGKVDAKPFTPNYQSPLQRRTPLYQSLRTPTTPTYASPSRPTISSLSLTGNASPTSKTAPYKASSLPNVTLNIPTYMFKGNPRGRVLIINNVKFIEDRNDRKGAKYDQSCLKNMFEQFGYKVDTEKNLKKKEMAEKIKSFRKKPSLKDTDICIVIMMSHGTNINEDQVEIAGGYTEVIGVDNQGLPIDEVLNEFSGDNCQYLIGKPKIFIFQCCRGTQRETLTIDAKPTTKCHADMLIAHSTLPGFVSLRDENRGSWYIQCIYKVFTEHAKMLDVESMLKIVDNDLSGKHPNFKQTTSYESRGFKRCYLLSADNLN